MDSSSPQLCKFAIASKDITPPVGIRHTCWGAASHEVAEGVHLPIEVKCFSFAPADKNFSFIICVLDHVSLEPKVIKNIKKSVSEKTGLPSEQVIVTFTHTHGAGNIKSSDRDLPGGEFIDPYLNQVVKTCGEAAAEAIEKSCQAWMSFASGTSPLATNREEYVKGSDVQAIGMSTEGISDQNFFLAKVDSLDGKPLGLILNYACHATTLAWQNRLISPDFPGVARKIIQESSGYECIYLQGACGDIGPINGFSGDLKRVENNGAILAYSVLGTLKSFPAAGHTRSHHHLVESGTLLTYWSEEKLTEPEDSNFDLFSGELALEYSPEIKSLDELAQEKKELEDKLEKTSDEQESANIKAFLERNRRSRDRVGGLPQGKEYPYPYHILKLGPSIWTFMQGEPYNKLQRELRKSFPNSPLFVTAYTDGLSCSYLPDLKTYDLDVYAIKIAVCAKGSLEKLTDTLKDKIEHMKNSSLKPST